MTLDDYLKTQNVTEAQFADRIGVHQSTVNRLRTGSIPSREVMAKIADATNGCVRADDFFFGDAQ
jgi:transcriptional regulator with XRE-family HTH domain